MKRLALLLSFLTILMMIERIQAQPPVIVTSHRPTLLYNGPGITYVDHDRLNPGIEVQLVERNLVGNWVYLQRLTPDQQIAQSGWAQSGYLNLPLELHFSEIPVTTLPDADLARAQSQTEQALYDVPLISLPVETVAEIFERGQARGYDPHTLTKVGDSVSADPSYLEIMGNPEPTLGAYDHLLPTLDYFVDSATRPSVAAKIGLSSYVVFDPFWADKTMCEANESPLQCEYRLKQPSFAFIMFGANDVLSMTYEEYGEQLEQIVQETLAHDIVPILSTFSTHPEHPAHEQALAFNLKVLEVAHHHDLPLINLWSATRALPDYGLDHDHIHMKQSGFNYLKYDSGHETWYGTSLRNLLALTMLDQLRHQLDLP